ncbi:carboxylate--amine ligase [Profundibacterium mesophilum]|uniref:Oxidoreductase n=1 Tax=Profundibacterium mesophilum KAUST100406-0324 TaxID=1037889 RepID=A0A921P0H7_9RHOB|nr:carboxylate--amine ligase [Profundibacterium mesophilum]KAF0676943.1 Oxidoreductase [Profundibacterium mesophilum KAUST100406-0324]
MNIEQNKPAGSDRLDRLFPEAARVASLPPLETEVPVLLLGGGSNAVAAARSLAGAGIRVSIAGRPGNWGMASRHCASTHLAPDGMGLSEFWGALLLGEDRALDGHVIFALCDESIEFLSTHYAALSRRYLTEDSDPELRLAMLDKMDTLERARAVGVPVPDFWPVAAIEEVEALRDRIRFPVMVKPIHSHLFVPVFGAKLFIVEDSFEALLAAARRAMDAGLEIMIVEMVPGPDDLLSSYYTYIDKGGQSLFHYTKRIIRRFPVNRGGACYHQSEWLPETAAMGRRFFEGIGWRGMGNIEFKRDPRDGKLKVIECNPRFTAAHRLVVAAGLPIDLMIYRSLTGQPVPVIEQGQTIMRLWNPIRDFFAFAELRRRGELGMAGYLRSLGGGGQRVLPVFSLSDPAPSLMRLREEGRRALGRLLRR